MSYGCCFSGEFLFWNWQEEEDQQQRQKRQQEITYLGMQNNLSNYISKYIYGNNNNNNESRRTTKPLFSTSPARFNKKRLATNHSTALYGGKKENPTIPEPIVPELIYLNRTSKRYPQYYCDFLEDDISRSSSTNEIRDSITPLERKRQSTPISESREKYLNLENPGDAFNQNDSSASLLPRGERIMIQQQEEDALIEKYNISYQSSYDTIMVNNDAKINDYSVQEEEEEEDVVEKCNFSYTAPTYDAVEVNDVKIDYSVSSTAASSTTNDDCDFLNQIEGKVAIWPWIMKPPTRKKLESVFRRIDEKSTGTIFKMKLNTAVLMMYPTYNISSAPCQSTENAPIAFRTAYKSCCSTTNSGNDNSSNEIVDQQEFSFFVHYLVYYHNLSHYFCFAANKNNLSSNTESIPTITRQNFQKAVSDMGFLKFIEKEDMIHDFFDMIDIHDEGVIQLEYICNYLAFHSSFTRFAIANGNDDMVVAISDDDDDDGDDAVVYFPTLEDYDVAL